MQAKVELGKLFSGLLLDTLSNPLQTERKKEMKTNFKHYMNCLADVQGKIFGGFVRDMICEKQIKPDLGALPERVRDLDVFVGSQKLAWKFIELVSKVYSCSIFDTSENNIYVDSNESNNFQSYRLIVSGEEFFSHVDIVYPIRDWQDILLLPDADVNRIAYDPVNGFGEIHSSLPVDLVRATLNCLYKQFIAGEEMSLARKDKLFALGWKEVKA